MECYCYLRNVHHKMPDGKTAHENIFCAQFDGPLIPFGAKLVSYKPIFRIDEARLHHVGNRMLPGIFMGHVFRAEGGWSGDLPVSDREDLENLTASDIHVKRFKRQEVAQEGKLLWPGAEGSPKLFDLPQPTRRNGRRNPEQDEKEEGDTLFERENGKYVWSMSGDFICRHHEVHRAKLYIPEATTFRTP